MKINILRHNCCCPNIMVAWLQAKHGIEKTNCPFYWKMRGGKGYHGNIHYFTFMGLRLIINTISKKDYQELMR